MQYTHAYKVHYLLQLNEVTVATLPNGTEVQIPVRRYRFTYTFDDSPSIPPQSDYVLSGECGDNTCTSMITLDIPARSQRLRVSVAAENVIGVGESSSLTVSSKLTFHAYNIKSTHSCGYSHTQVLSKILEDAYRVL